MDREELDNVYLKWINEYTNNNFNREYIPNDIRTAIKELSELDPLNYDNQIKKTAGIETGQFCKLEIYKRIFENIRPFATSK